MELKCASKGKKIAWKALHGTLPGLAVLAGRHIKTAVQCPICKQGPEDIKHLMFSCLRARLVWNSLGLMEAIDLFLPTEISGSVILEEILRSNSPMVPTLGRIGCKEAIVVGAWYIWWQRREAVKGEKLQTPSRSAFAILALTSNFQGAKPGVEPHEITWSKPNRNSYNLSIDVAFFPNGDGAAGIVL